MTAYVIQRVSNNQFCVGLTQNDLMCYTPKLKDAQKFEDRQKVQEILDILNKYELHMCVRVHQS